MDFSAISTYIPITVISAGLLFVIKEAVELIRRIKSERRRISAIKLLVAEEMEQNHWTHKVLKRTIREIDEALRDYPDPCFRLVRTQSGRELFRYRKEPLEDVGMESGHPLPPVRQQTYDRMVVDVASLDKKLYVQTREAYDAIKEMEHVRSTLVDLLDRVDLDVPDGFMAGFLEYATAELEDIEKKMKTFYSSITGKELVNMRMR